RHLNLRSDVGTLTPRQSAELMALLPEVTSDGRFGVTFPQGRFDLAATAITIDGLAGENLAAEGTWDGGVLALDTMTGTLGGVTYEARLTAFGTVVSPEMSGTVRLAVENAAAPGLARVFDAVRTPPGVRDWLAR